MRTVRREDRELREDTSYCSVFKTDRIMNIYIYSMTRKLNYIIVL